MKQLTEDLYCTGPDEGPLPSVFYFALSAQDSLSVDPYNQLIQFSAGRNIRFFSLTLPAHGEGLSPHHAMEGWAKEMGALNQFFDRALKAVEYVVANGLADPTKMAIAGLSRGGFIATHLAAREARFRTILEFAPVTRLSKLEDFKDIDTEAFDVFRLLPKLENRKIRIYIGNNDTRVDTRSCLDFALALALHSPQTELIMSPSVGRHGHGTPPEIFRDGADWLAKALL